MDNNGQVNLKDAIVALQICSGEKISSVQLETSITKGRIALEDVLFIMNQIGK